MSIAIVIVTYNRSWSLTRLLGSIANANFEGYSDIDLIISIDSGGESEVKKIAADFNWSYGVKTILMQKINLGLRKHILLCGDLTQNYGNIILLEDDCFVSPNFYDFASQALKYYGRDDQI